MAKNDTGTRKLVLSDGSSNKFWNIALDGCSHTAHFGRIGTDGQKKTKEFDSEEEARQSYDKLIASKLKKGYQDAGGEMTVQKTSATQTTAAKTSPAVSKKETEKKTTKKVPDAAMEVFDEVPADASEDVDLRITHEIGLDPKDWFLAPYRKQKPLVRDEPKSFDQADCLERLSNLRVRTYGWETCWETLKLPDSLSREEAHFWLVATTTERHKDTKMRDFAQTLVAKKFDGKIDATSANEILVQAKRLADEAMLALANLIEPEDYIEMILKKPPHKQSWERSSYLGALVAGFREYVLPYLDDNQLEPLRKSLRKNWKPNITLPSNYDRFPGEYYLAAMIGLHDELYDLVSTWEDDRYTKDDWHDHRQSPQELLFGLGSADLIESEWRRLRLKMRSPEDIRGFLACTEFAALDCVADSIIRQTNKEECKNLIDVLALVRAPEAAEPMLRCKQSSKAPASAREWLDKHVGNAVAGLIETAGGRGNLAEAAIDYLRGVKRRGYADVIVKLVKKAEQSGAAVKVKAEVIDHEEKVHRPFDGNSTPKWLAKEIDSVELKKTKLPAWANTAMLPPLSIGDDRLNDEQSGTVLRLLAATPVTERHPLFVALHEHIAKPVRDQFAWALFNLWQENGWVSKEKWAMGAIGHLGDDQCVLKLTPMIRVWPGESQHARAVFGLECLRAIGSNEALMQLSGIAQKLKFKGLKNKANEFISEIAKERGMSTDELQDCVVPDCGLDENGHRAISYGTRSFEFVLGGDLKPMVRDEKGNLRPNPPNPGAKDDEEIANASLTEWKIIKKQIRDTAVIQASRLEQAMVVGRRWKVGDFESLLVRHPLMTHLVQKLIWGGYDPAGKRVATFRVTEERDYADPDDGVIEIGKMNSLGIVHPLDMSGDELSRWGEIMSDYEIISPFPQLGRPVYELEPGEAGMEVLTRFHGIELYAPTMVFTLEKFGWIRGEAMDGGCFDEHSKQFPAANVTAVIGYEGTVAMGYIEPDEILKTETVHFCQGMRDPSGYGWGSKKKMKLGEVPAIVISEVIAELQILKSKAK